MQTHARQLMWWVLGFTLAFALTPQAEDLSSGFYLIVDKAPAPSDLQPGPGEQGVTFDYRFLCEAEQPEAEYLLVHETAGGSRSHAAPITPANTSSRSCAPISTKWLRVSMLWRPDAILQTLLYWISESSISVIVLW